MQTTRSNLIQDLRRQLRCRERDVSPVVRQGMTTGLDAIDRLLPNEALRPGMILECLSSAEGAGVTTLMLSIARQLAGAAGALLVLDARGDFHPLAAMALGIDLRRLIVIKPPAVTDALWVLEQALRSRGLAVTLAGVDQLSDHAFRRLQLAAETGGGFGFLIRDAIARRQPTWADVRLLVEPRPALPSSRGRRIRVELLRARGVLTGGAVELEICDETGRVHLASELADPAALSCALRA